MLSGPTPRRARRASSSISRPRMRSTCTTRRPERHWPEVLVGREDAHLLDLVAEAGGGRGERVVGLELAHRPDGHPQRTDGLLGGVELREELGRHALLGLVAGEEVVAEGADGVVEGDRDVGDRLAPGRAAARAASSASPTRGLDVPAVRARVGAGRFEKWARKSSKVPSTRCTRVADRA